MDQILGTITDTIGGFFSNPIVQLAIQALAIYIVILWLAAAYWAFRDMQLRSENPVLPYLAAALIVLFTPVLFLFGVFVYKISRPQFAHTRLSRVRQVGQMIHSSLTRREHDGQVLIVSTSARRASSARLRS